MTVGELYVLFGISTDASSFKNAEKALTGLKSAALGFLSISALKSFTGFVEHIAESAVHIIGTSQALGLSTRALQQWTYIAKQSGSNVQQLTQGVGMFEKNLRAFAQGGGSKAFKQSMRDVHLTAADAKNDLASEDGVTGALMKVSKAFKDMGNTGARGAISKGLFGARAANTITADLANGPEAIKEKLKRLDALGGVIGDKKLQDLKKFNNSIQDLKTSLSALATNVVGALAPGFTKMINAASKWIAENKDLIAGAFSTAVKILGAAFSALGSIISWVGDTIKKAIGGDDGATAILIGLATVIGGLVVPALYAMIAPIVIALAPILAIAAVVALLYFGLQKLIKGWGGIQKAAADAYQWIMKKASEFGDWVESIPGKIVDAMAGVGRTIRDAFGDALDWVKKKAHDAWEAIKRPFGGGDGGDSPHARAQVRSYAKQNPPTVANARTGSSMVGWAGGDKSGGTGSVTEIHQTNHIEINGVKNAEQIPGKTFDALHRHAASGLALP